MDDFRITRWNLSSLAGRRDPRPEPESATIMAITAGSVRYRTGDAEGDAGSGSVLVLRETEPIWFSTEHGADVVEIRLPRPPAGRSVADRICPAITAVPVTPGETALLSLALYLLEPARPRSTAVERAIAPLSAAVIDEHFPEVSPPSLRDEMLVHIEHNLHDPHLGPESIAESFGISLRWAHHVFTIDADTIGRHIRHRRIEFVQERLRSSTTPPLLKSLAQEAGFRSRDNLAKVFKAETGLTVHEYLAFHQGRGAQHR